MSKQNIIITLLSAILIIILLVLIAFGWWAKGEYGKYVESTKATKTQPQEASQPEESEPEQPAIEQADVLPSCYDSGTIDTVKSVIFDSAIDRDKVRDNQEIINLIHSTQMDLEDIVVISEATEQNPVQVCEAKLNISYPYLNEDELKKVSGDFIFWLQFTGKRREFENLPDRFNYEVKYSYNQDGERSAIVDVDWAKTYATAVYYMAARYHELQKTGK